MFGSGCASCHLPQIDPSGQRLFVPRESQVIAGNPALPALVVRQPSVAISPRQLIAPVGTEVIMLSGVCGTDNLYSSGEKIEWMLSPESAGEFGTIGEGGWFPWCTLFGKSSQKLTNSYAVSKTVNSPVQLTRGTLTPTDDVTVNAGQAWITVTSPTEGTSVVTALAPSVTGWNQRKATGTIHWIDAQWVFPPPAVNPQGQNHVFTTSINRHTNGTPLTGWRVRYEILDGPPAGFAPDGREMAEVKTDELGQASVEIVPKGLEGGTCRINVQIIRPAQSVGATLTPELILGSRITTKTWTAPQISLDVSGPAQAAVGATIGYRISVTNPGDLVTKRVVVSEDLPPGVSFVDSTPAATVTGRKLEWQLGDLAARQTQSIEVNLRAEQAGSFNHCVNVSAAENLAASDCAATSITTAQLDVRVAAPEQAEIGQSVRFEIVVSNKSAVPATGLEITSTFDAGLKHLVAQSPITRAMGDLQPGTSQTIYMTFQVVAAGRSCNQVEVVGAAGLRGAASACLTAFPPTSPAIPAPNTPVNPAPGPNQPTQPTQPPVQPQGQPALEMSTSAPRQARVGDLITYAVDVFNRGDVPLTNVRLSTVYDDEVRIMRAEPGFEEKRFNDELVWNIPRIEAGQSRKLLVECRCEAQSPRACLRATFTSGQTGPRADMACVEIIAAGAALPKAIPDGGGLANPAPKPAPIAPPPAAVPNQPATPLRPAELVLTMSDLGDPIALGAKVSYRIQVRNAGELSAQGVELKFTLPPELIIETTDASVEGIRSYLNGNIVRFDKVAELRPGRNISYTVVCRSVKPGQAKATCTVSSNEQTQPTSVIETTEILAKNP